MFYHRTELSLEEGRLVQWGEIPLWELPQLSLILAQVLWDKYGYGILSALKHTDDLPGRA
jgi:hypothetical protein